MNKWKDKPFAIIGVNIVGQPPAKVQAVMRKNNLPWRTFVDGPPIGAGPIAAKWNFPATPTFYVIDHQGKIRHKWVGPPGEKLMDTALGKCVEEAEAAIKGQNR